MLTELLKAGSQAHCLHLVWYPRLVALQCLQLIEQVRSGYHLLGTGTQGAILSVDELLSRIVNIESWEANGKSLIIVDFYYSDFV